MESLQSMCKAMRRMVVSTSHKAHVRSLMVSPKSAVVAKSSTKESMDHLIGLFRALKKEWVHAVKQSQQL